MTGFMPKILTVAILSALLAACGGDSDSGSNSSSVVQSDTDNKSVTTIDDVEVIEVIEEPKDIEVKDDIAIDINANSDDKVVAIPDVAIDKVVLERLNARRYACGFGTLSVSQKLTNAASNHANYLMYMSEKSDETFQGHYEVYKDIYSGSKNPYYSGYTVEERISTDDQIGSKAIAVDYKYNALGENLSFLSYNRAFADKISHKDIALSSINGLLAAPYHLASLVNPNFSQIGISYVSEPVKKRIRMSDGSTQPATGSILELVSARPLSQSLPVLDKVLSYPCNGVEDTAYKLENESPNPFKGTSRNLKDDPIGQPIYILGPKAIEVTESKMVNKDTGKQIALKQLNSDTDPNDKLKDNEVILMPLSALKPNSEYTVSYKVSVDNAAVQNKSFSFKTKSE